MSRSRFFVRSSMNLGSFMSDRLRLLRTCRLCVLNRLCSTESREQAIGVDRMRFKWPRDSYMPSSLPYNMFPMISTSDEAKCMVSNLDDLSRQLLLQELRQTEEQKVQMKSASLDVSVTASQLYQVFVFNCLPFVGFGILDNGIMIVAGEYIDVTIGAVLGISTMAAAALGNLVSDVAGVGSAGYIELLVSKLGVETPDISLAQSQLKSVRWTVGFGRALGISIGCVLGMIPLLFYSKDENDKSSEMESNIKDPVKK